MDYKKIEELLEKYWEGESTLTEEKELKEFFSLHQNIPEHLAMYREQFGYYTQVQELTLSQDFEKDLLREIKASSKPSRFLLYRRVFSQVAAAILFLILGYSLALMRQGNSGTENQALSALNEKLSELADTQNMLVLSMLEQPSPSERLKAVNYAAKIGSKDQSIVEALINTLNEDPNSNVRLAAANALSLYQGEKEVRLALIQSLSIQEDPVLQIALINMLIAMKENKAKSSIENFLKENQEMPENVKKTIEGELRKL